MFTALNMSCGFVAITFAIKGEFYKALYLIIIGTFCDLFDGKVARWTGTQSSFGEQFDSLSDLLSFGVAPALIFYLSYFQDSGRKGVVCALIYCLCTALRLARFNANIEKVSAKFFEGLPSPVAAMSLIGFCFFNLSFPQWNLSKISYFYIVIYGLLMVSTIPFVSLKENEFIGKNPKKFFLLTLLFLFSLFVYEDIFIFGVINLYVFSCITYFIINKEKFSKGIIEIDD